MSVVMSAKSDRIYVCWMARIAVPFVVVSLVAGTIRSEEPERPIRDIGVPVKSVNWVRLHPGRSADLPARIYATMGQNANSLFVLQIDPQSGATLQFHAPVPKANFPTASLMSRSGRFYIGAAYAGHLLCFDPETQELKDLGAIHPGHASFPCRLDEDADGRIWIGSYGTADLTCYDPDRGEFARYGRMDDVDMYNYPLVNRDGTVACLIRMTRPHVVVFDPKTGEKQVVGPVTSKGKETLDMRRGNDGWVYIVSSVGNYRIEGSEAIAVDVVPPPKPAGALPDGSTFAFADTSEQLHRRLVVTRPDGEQRSFVLDYEAAGNDIFSLHRGPDGCLYGSSYLPLHLFRYSPPNGSSQKGQLTNLGVCSKASGEAYSMANLDGRMYISSYPGARLSVFDPTEPYQFGTQPDSNPRDLGRIDDISYRPRSTLGGPLGRVWLASIPDYGRWGGPLSYYDSKTGEKKAYKRIVGDASCYTLAHLEKQQLLAIGTSVSGGSGTRSRVDQAGLVLWDYRSESKVWEGTLDSKVSVVNALVVAPDGRLFGTVRGGKKPKLFVFDAKSRKFTNQVPLPDSAPLDLGLQIGPDGMIYGCTASTIYRLDPKTLKVETLVREDGAFNVAGPILGDSLFFATGCRLRAVKLF